MCIHVRNHLSSSKVHSIVQYANLTKTIYTAIRPTQRLLTNAVKFLLEKCPNENISILSMLWGSSLLTCV